MCLPMRLVPSMKRVANEQMSSSWAAEREHGIQPCKVSIGRIRGDELFSTHVITG